MATFLKVYILISDVSDLLEYVLQLIEEYEKLGPLPGILLTFIEAFFPFLPLFVFVMANSVAYGLLEGFIYSWIGASAGSVTVFFLIRSFKKIRIIKSLTNNKQVKKLISFVSKRGFGLIFILLCFPFSPSSIINIVVAISKVSWKQFILAVIFGKAIMIFSIAYVGTSMMQFAQNPLKTIVITLLIVLFWFIGKVLEKRIVNSK